MGTAIEPIKLGGKMVGPGYPVFIVAEIANCHEGSFATAKKMVDVISQTGVDAVKFQLHIPENEMTRDHPKFVTQGKRSLSIQELSDLKNYAQSRDLYFLCTPFSREAADQLEGIGCDAFKIGSGELTDLPFLEHMARKGKPMIVSTGMSTWEEIEEAVSLIQSFKTPLMLLHAISVYPADYEQLNLGVIPRLRERFGVPVGLSDHVPEILPAIAAVPYGAALIEKHYTLDRNHAGTNDHKVSLEPQEWKSLVEAVRKVEKACGEERRIFDEERPTVEWARRSVVAIKNVPAGSVITADMVWTKRPLYFAIPARDMRRVIGRRVKWDIPEDSRINWDDLE